MKITQQMAAQIRVAARGGIVRNLRITKAMNEQLEELAKRHDITAAALIRILLEDALNRHGENDDHT